MTDLTDPQRARVAALRVAREVLDVRTAEGYSTVDAVDLTRIARFIVTGEDPYSGGDQ